MGDKAEPWPILISALRKGETKLFQVYWVFLLIK